MGFTKILVAFDFSKTALRALATASEIARQDGAELTIIHVGDVQHAFWVHRAEEWDPVGPDTKDALVVEIEDLERRVMESAEPYIAKIRVRTIVRLGIPVQEIHDEVVAGGHDLVILGATGRSGLSRILLGSVADRVLRNARVPVMVVHAGGAPDAAEHETGEVSLRRVLVAVDFSPVAYRALRQGIARADRNNGQITLLHVLVPDASGWFGTDGTSHQIPKRIEAAMEKLFKATPPASPQLSPAYRWAIGNPAEEIIKCAQKADSELIVIGAHGRSPLRRRFFGSVTGKVVRLARVPVLVCP